MKLPVEYIDILKVRPRVASRQSFRIQPRTEPAQMMIHRRCGVPFPLKKLLYLSDPRSVFDTRIENRPFELIHHRYIPPTRVWPPVGCPFRELVSRHRPGNAVPLRDLTPELQQKQAMIDRLYSFSYSLAPECVGQHQNSL